LTDNQEIEQLKTALKQGFAITPRSHEMPSREDRDSHIEIIARVVYATWNRDKRPSHIRTIVDEALSLIDYEKRMGMWKRPIPSRRTLERSTNYAADPRWYQDKEDKRPKIVAIKPGWYIPNPQFFDGETKQRLESILVVSKLV
jgi:hypothetical protein